MAGTLEWSAPEAGNRPFRVLVAQGHEDGGADHQGIVPVPGRREGRDLRHGILVVVKEPKPDQRVPEAEHRPGRGDGEGDGPAIVTVQAGDTVWDLATAHYGFCDQSLLDVIQNANPDLADPGLIHRGQQIALPALFADAAVPAPKAPAGAAT